MKNEVGYIVVGDERLKAEVLRVQGDVADMQVFEETTGVKVGDPVELSGEMLSAALGPGACSARSSTAPGALAPVARDHGFFLPRGVQVEPLDQEKKWSFEPGVSTGARLAGGQVLGTVPEGPFSHKIMVPFDELEPVEVSWIRGGSCTVSEPIARIQRADGQEREVPMNAALAGARADPAGDDRAARSRAALPDRADHDHAAHHRHLPAHCTGRHGVHSRALRSGQDRTPELYRQALDDRHRDHYRLW